MNKLFSSIVHVDGQDQIAAAIDWQNIRHPSDKLAMDIKPSKMIL
jgi:hypothetical protein